MYKINMFIFIVFSILILVTINTPARGDNINMGSGDWAPYVSDPKIHNGLYGYLPEIAKVVFEKAGHTFHMRYEPFNRIIKMIKDGKLHGVPGVYRGDVPDYVFPEESQGVGMNTFYVRKGTLWKFKDINSLFSLKGQLGLIKNYYYGEEMKGFVIKRPDKIDMLYGHDVQTRSAKKLLMGRISAWLEDDQVAQYTFNRLGIIDKIISAGTIGYPLPVYIAFSPTHPKSKQYARMIVEGVNELRQTGELDKILKKYGLKDWKKS